MAVIDIKQNPNNKSAATVGLGKYMRSKMPNTWEIVYAGQSADGRWVTGLDDKAAEVRSIRDPEEKELKIRELKELRERLEDETGFDLDAKPSNTFWETYAVRIGSVGTIDLDTAKGQIEYYMLLANGHVAPELALASAPEFRQSKYYLSRIEEETSSLASRRKEKGAAIAKLHGLSENKNRLYLIARFLLGPSIKENFSVDTLYNRISDFIESPVDTKNANARKFLSVAEKPVEELQYKITVTNALEAHVIRMVGGTLYHGTFPLGKNTEDAVIILSNPGNSIEYQSIVDELEEKSAIR